MAQIAPLTGLRGIAAYLVLIAHALDASLAGKGHAHFIAVGLAHFGMSLFFVLSGFVICYNYEEKLDLPYGRRRFFIARFARLFPLYAVVTIFYAVPQIGHANLVDVLTHVTMTQSWFNTENAFFFPPTWSISTEWFFYFVFAYLLVAIKLPLVGFRTMAIFCAGAFCALAIIFLLQAPVVSALSNPLFVHESSDVVWIWLTYYSPFVRVWEFFLGVITARTYSAYRPNIPAAAAFIAAGWCLLLIFVGHQALAGTFFGEFLPNFAFAPAIAVIMLYSTKSKWTVAGAVLSCSAMLWLGEISYSVYLLQSAGRNTALLFVQHPVLDVVFTCIFTTLIASVSFLLIEKPARRFIRENLEPRALSHDRRDSAGQK